MILWSVSIENRKNYITILIKTYIETLPPLAQLVRARGCRSISHTKVFAYEVLSADTAGSSAQIREGGLMFS